MAPFRHPGFYVFAGLPVREPFKGGFSRKCLRTIASCSSRLESVFFSFDIYRRSEKMSQNGQSEKQVRFREYFVKGIALGGVKE